ncbi:GGDEF domain-containing protein [Mycobacterium sp. 1274761.0]|uniref:GGDEF domain-containing protein n=1 Tax=Mycobacterium sp. 1274761.0 TaxID=1834077 RepID=UPI0018D3196F|nr:GGDEF domain-containing protein [Mycobacterium sp. 1274761.0]
MAIVAASSGLAPFALFVQLRGTTTATILIGSAGAAFCAGMTVFWLTRWPTRRQSEVFVCVGTLSIAAWSLAQPATSTAALGCAATAVTGGYMAFFHTNKLVLFNFVIGIAAGLISAIRLAGQTNFATAASAFWIIWLLNVVVPLAIRGTTRAMGQYATHSDQDPLTGLLNRRGFSDAVHGALVSARPEDTHLAVLMLDLDDFKRINDSHGHQAGDRALLAVAELLRCHVPTRAAICRAGGEEFLIALTVPPSGAHSLAVRLCTAVAALPHAVTASIGHTSAAVKQIVGAHATTSVDELIRSADTAMYAAKASGGNQARSAANPITESNRLGPSEPPAVTRTAGNG